MREATEGLKMNKQPFQEIFFYNWEWSGKVARNQFSRRAGWNKLKMKMTQLRCTFWHDKTISQLLYLGHIEWATVQYVWCEENTDHTTNITINFEKYGGGSIIHWRCISLPESDRNNFEGRIDGAKYRVALQENLIGRNFTHLRVCGNVWKLLPTNNVQLN